MFPSRKTDKQQKTSLRWMSLTHWVWNRKKDTPELGGSLTGCSLVVGLYFIDIQEVNDTAKFQITPQNSSLFIANILVHLFPSQKLFFFFPQISPKSKLSGRLLGQKFSSVILETQLVEIHRGLLTFMCVAGKQALSLCRLPLWSQYPIVLANR